MADARNNSATHGTRGSGAAAAGGAAAQPSPARIGLVGAPYEKTLFGTPAQPCILSFFNVREAAELRPLCKEVADATRACTFASADERHWKDDEDEEIQVGRGGLGLFRHCFPKAETVVVDGTDMVDAEAIHLRGIRRVTIHGGLSDDGLTDAGIALMASPKLEELDLANIGGSIGAAFPKLRGLKRLRLTACSLDHSRCRFPPSLVHLTMRGCAAAHMEAEAPLNNTVLAGLHSLETLTLHASLFVPAVEREEQGQQELMSFPALRELTITHRDMGPQETTCPVVWSRAPTLQKVFLSAIRGVVNFPEPLSALPLSVREAAFVAFDVTDADLARLTGLQTLLVSASDVLTGTCLAKLPALTTLELRGCDALQHCKLHEGAPLTELLLHELAMLKDSGFSPCPPTLTSVYLEDCAKLTDGCLTHFPGLKSLTAKYCRNLLGPGVLRYAQSHPALTYVRLSQKKNAKAGAASAVIVALRKCAAGLEGLGFTHVPRRDDDEEQDVEREKVKMVRGDGVVPPSPLGLH